MTSKTQHATQRIVALTDEEFAAIPNASPERLAQLGLSLGEAVTAPVDKAIARARERGKVRSTKLPPRLDRGRPRLRVEGEQLAEKKARAARVLDEALKLPGVSSLLCYGFTKGDVRVLFTALRRAAENAGACDWPVDKLACMAGVSRATVTRALARLHLAAHLAVTWRPRSGRKHETSLIRCGLSDLAAAVWSRLTMRRSAVDECGRAAFASRRKELRQKATLDASKESGEPNRSFVVEVSASGLCGKDRSGERSALDSPSPERPPSASEEKMLSGGRVLHVPVFDHKRGAMTTAPDWVPYADPEAARWGERQAPHDLDPDELVPVDGPLTSLQAALRKSVALMAAKRDNKNS